MSFPGSHNADGKRGSGNGGGASWLGLTEKSTFTDNWASIKVPLHQIQLPEAGWEVRTYEATPEPFDGSL